MGLAALLDRSNSIARPGYDRWRVPPAAVAVYMSIGQVYALGALEGPMAQVVGVTRRSAQDWSPESLAWLFPASMAVLGLTSLVLSGWIERVGPRQAMFTSACFFGAGFLIAAVGVGVHALWIVYAGYAVVGGVGLGIGYAAPVSTLIRWFPERPGNVTGIALAGFAVGALFGGPFADALRWQLRSPTDAGVVWTLVAMGVFYFTFILYGAFTIRIPAADWLPPTYTSGRRTGEAAVPWAPRVGTPAGRSDAERRPVAKSVHVSAATRTPQFWFLWLLVCLAVTAGSAVLSQAFPMVQEHFPVRIGAVPAAGFVALLALSNVLGRALWAGWTDQVGRRRAHFVLLALAALLAGYVPTAAATASIVTYVVAVAVVVSVFGGVLSSLPTYVRDLFGDLHVGIIHARLVFAWSCGAIGGPLLARYVAEFSIARGASYATGYSALMYAVAGLLGLALVVNWLVRGVDPRHHLPEPATAGTR